MRFGYFAEATAITIYKSATSGEKWEGPSWTIKKGKPFNDIEKNSLIVFIYRLIFPFKMLYWDYLGEITMNFFHVGPYFYAL